VLEQLRQITQNTPAMDWTEIRVFASHSQDERLKANPEYFGDFRKRLYRHRVKREELHATPNRFSTSARCPAFISLMNSRTTTPGQRHLLAVARLSRWKARDYYGSDQIAAFRSDPAVNFVYAHTSGHAPVADLQRLAAALNPRKLVPIHTEHGEDFSQVFANVVTHDDGEVLSLNDSSRCFFQMEVSKWLFCLKWMFQKRLE